MSKKNYASLRNGSDVRGIALAGTNGDAIDLTQEAVQDIAAAFALWLAKKCGKEKVKISVGHDSRVSAKSLEAGVVRGIVETGNDVEKTSLSSTPSMFALLQDPSRDSDGSIMITASHLPYHRNGLKFFTKEGGLEGKDVETLLSLASEERTLPSAVGTETEKPYLDEYAASLVEKVRTACGKKTPLKGKRIVVDAGNGAGGFFVDKVLIPLGANTEGSQFLNPDGLFPNHIPNPENKDAMKAICAAVKAYHADLGVIFDTDVDRAAAVDETGEEINRNRLIALISSVLLKEKSGTIVTDSVTSDGLTSFIERNGGRHHRFKRGYKNVINEAIRLNEAGEYTPLAIETSGHAAFKENYFLDDGAYLITRLLIAFAKEAEKGGTLGRLIRDLPEAAEEKEVRLQFRPKTDFRKLGKDLIEQLREHAKESSCCTPCENDYEGVRIRFDKENGDGWLLVRLSLHEPVLPTNAESNSEGGTKKIYSWLSEFLRQYDFLNLNPLYKALEEKDSTKKQTGDTKMNVQQTTVNALRVLSAEAIEKAKSGHPGLPLGCAPIAYTLFQKFLKANPQDTTWANRDRFVLSAGHGSALYYTLLHLYGYGIETEDLKNFRQLDSKTPGHPEYGHTIGVETTTGPLGQGIANAVGMAVAEAHLAAKYNKPGFNVVDHYTYAICGDGCLEEGISYEACSFAGTNKLGKLILLYDDNDITIEGDTDVTFKENIGARFAAQNWQVLHVDLVTKPDDTESLAAAIETAKARTDKPSIIVCHTKIGYGSPLEGSEKCHGAPLGAANLQALKEKLGWTEEEPFACPEEVYAHCKNAADASAKAETRWQQMFDQYARTYPELAEEYENVMKGVRLDVENTDDLFGFEKPLATRQTSSIVLNKIAAKLPSLMGGSADLGPSNLSEMKNTDEIDYGTFSADNYAGRNMHYGIREHAMIAIANGMQLHGGITAYAATFFVFTDYCKPAMRLSALMKLPVTYIFTHDSIGVGEDGPTHQPVEQLIALRSIPGMKVYRPADGNETAAAWISAMTGNEPTAIVLTRQALPQYAGSGKEALKGGYVLEDCENEPDVLLIGTGSEVELCVKAKAALAEEGIRARVVSVPSVEVFEKQSEEYKESILPSCVKARVCVEAGSPYSWYRYAGTYGEIVGMDTFGASAPAGKLFEKFGFTTENVVEKAKASIRKANER